MKKEKTRSVSRVLSPSRGSLCAPGFCQCVQFGCLDVGAHRKTPENPIHGVGRKSHGNRCFVLGKRRRELFDAGALGERPFQLSLESREVTWASEIPFSLRQEVVDV